MSTGNGSIKTERYVAIAFGLVGTVGAAFGVWGYAMSPIDGRLVALEKRFEAREERINFLEHENVRLSQSLTEIETQFRQLSHINNIHFAEEHKFTQLLWKKTFGDDLPDMTYFPEVGK